MKPFEYHSPDDIGMCAVVNTHAEWFQYPRREPDHLRRLPWHKEATRTSDKAIAALSVVVAVILLALPAQASEYEEMTLANDGGGEIVLTNLPCKDRQSLLLAYTYTEGGNYESGCWTLLKDKVHVIWKNGVRRVYQGKYFQRNDR